MYLVDDAADLRHRVLRQLPRGTDQPVASGSEQLILSLCARSRCSQNATERYCHCADNQRIFLKLSLQQTFLPKQGHCSVGVAHQYSGNLGKNSHCQCLVSLTLARREVPVPIALRLCVPKAWTDHPSWCTRVGVPAERQFFRTKANIALEEIDRVRAAGVRFDILLADAGYGTSASFRHALSERGLTWAVGILRIQTVYPADVLVVRAPDSGRGRPPK